jgi:diguanylate cyclase (GGDEF)-like protein
VYPDDASRLLAEICGAAAGRCSGRSFEYRVRTADGAWRILSAVASNLADVAGAPGVLLSGADVTEQMAREEALCDLALRDPLTGLASRDILVAHIEATGAERAPLSVVFLDVDHFRRINECIGHSVGDAVLRSLGARIASVVPPSGLVARFGGDTFVLVLDDLEADRALSLVCELLARIAAPLFIAGHELRVTASAGFVSRGPAGAPESLLRDAEAALTQAKKYHRGGVVVFSDQIRAHCVERLAIEADLRYAAARHELRLHFQPIVDLAGGRPNWDEALLRWARRGGEVLTPDTFLAVAEESGLIVPIGEWVVAAVIKELQSDPTLRANVNLSARQLAVPDLADKVEHLLGSHQVTACRLAFEVTETVLMENFETATRRLNRLRHLGCPVGLDDFGTGYSSLSYLHRLPLDFIKLDRSLVDAVDTDPHARAIAASFISLAKALSLGTVAEGIERPSLIGPLTAMGCDYGQGWHFGHPAPRCVGPTADHRVLVAS